MFRSLSKRAIRPTMRTYRVEVRRTEQTRVVGAAVLDCLFQGVRTVIVRTHGLRSVPHGICMAVGSGDSYCVPVSSRCYICTVLFRVSEE